MSVEITFLEPGNKFSVKVIGGEGQHEQTLADALALRQKIVAATGGVEVQNRSDVPVTPEQFAEAFPPGLPEQQGGEAPVYVRTPEDPASDKQIQFLGRLGFKGQTAGMTKGQAKTQIDQLLGK